VESPAEDEEAGQSRARLIPEGSKMITPRSHVPYVPITSTDLDASVDFFDASVYGRCWGASSSTPVA
jgi:hypothetical protein